MPFNTEFYRRRLEQRLENERGLGRLVIHSEAALLAVPDDTDFVRHAYRFYLDRDPDLSGLQYFGDMLDRLGRLAVVAEIKSSDEGRRRPGAPEYIPHDAPPAPPAAPEVEATPVAVEPPPPEPDVIAESVASALAPGPVELADLISIEDPAAFLTAVYRRTLGRPPDPDGLAHYLRRLQDGESRERLLHGLVSTPEAQVPGRVFTWNGQPWRGPSFTARARSFVGRARPGASRRSLEARLDDVVRAHARLERGLTDHHARQAGISHAVSDQAGVIQLMHQDLLLLAQSIVSASRDTAQELQRLRAGQQALRVSTEALAARLRPRSDDTPRQSVLAGDVVASVLDGFIVGVPSEEWRLAAYHAFRGVLEPGLTRRFCSSLKPGMVAVDVGANIGMYTLYGARLAGASGAVYSFEPTPRIFGILKDNVQVNGFLETGRVHLQQLAVTDRRGTSPFAVHRTNNGHNNLFPDGLETEVIEVETTTLDAALVGAARVDLMKIDAEGAEPLIWDGMIETRQRNPQLQVFMEFFPALLKRAGHDPWGFLDRISAEGFAVHRVDDQTGALSAWTRSQGTPSTSVNLMLTRSDR